MPNANPKNTPAISPTLSGNSSCAYTRIAENADARMSPMTIVSMSRPQEVRVRQSEREGQDAENGDPNHPFATDAIADRSSENGAGGNGRKEYEQVELRTANGYVELRDQIKGVVAGQAREVHVFREDERDEDRERDARAPRMNARVGSVRRTDRRARACRDRAFARTIVRSATARGARRAPRWSTRRCSPVRTARRGMQRAGDRMTSRGCRPPEKATARARGGRPTPSAPRARTPGEIPPIPNP